MSTSTNSPVQETQSFFKKQFSANLSDEAARQVNENIAGIYTLLAKWKREQSVSKYGATKSAGDCHVG